MSFEVAEMLELVVRSTAAAAADDDDNDDDDVLLTVRTMRQRETDVCRDNRPPTTLSILQATN